MKDSLKKNFVNESEKVNYFTLLPIDDESLNGKRISFDDILLRYLDKKRIIGKKNDNAYIYIYV